MTPEPKNLSLHTSIVALFLTSLAMAFVVKKIVNAGVLVACVFALYWLWCNRQVLKLPQFGGDVRVLSLVFAVPFVSSFGLDFVRGEFNVGQLDEYLRILIALPVLYMLLSSFNPGFFNRFEFAFSSSFLIFAGLYLSGYGTDKWEYLSPRASTYFVDANTAGLVGLIGVYFSSYKFLMALKSRSILHILFYLSCSFAALFILFDSQTRMAWLAAVLMLPLTVLFTRHKFVVLVLAITAVGIVGFNSDTVQKRYQQAHSELVDYFSGKPVDMTTSLGQRLSFYKAAMVIGFDKPLLGHGVEELRQKIRSEPERLGLNEATKGSLLQHGVHNQYLEKLMFNGILGFIVSLALYLVPCWYFFGCLKQRKGGVHESAAMLGVTVCLAYFFSGLSMILTLKYVNSFYAGMVVLLYATIHRSNFVDEAYHA